MNEQELSLSKLSYVNKDFRSIYPDLLDLVKTLTNRWDPSSSNESDPGVVLLKVGAFLADHLNYNIDKNILEAFLPSATQEESVRKIAEFGGYTPRYYRSAVGNVNITYNPEEFTGSFYVPEFTMVISNDDGSIVYTQLESFAISEKNVPVSCKFIEGTIQRLAVDSGIITLNNLDDYRRIYFPNKYIAENGIFIYNVDESGNRISESWGKTNYIYTQPIGTKCFKIDFDSSKSLPYVEFPTDIANLIGDGIAIYYVYTAGSYGNVKRGELNSIVSVNVAGNSLLSDRFTNLDDYNITNNSSIMNGCEPESIDEIYDSYKKVVGTFDTLVSTQDYSNAVRTVEDDNGEKFVSNGLVTDRRIDYNNSLNILSSKSTGTYFTNVALNFGQLTFIAPPADPTTTGKKGDVYTDASGTHLCVDVTDDGPIWEVVTSLDASTLNEYFDCMTPYDLIIYALQKYAESDYNSTYYWQALDRSFKQINGDADMANDTPGTEDNLIAALEDYKCINHIFKDLDDGQIYCFKNYVPLNVDIVPFNKVTWYERREILDNIRKAISDNFNASKVEFGEELNYDTVKKVIEEADSRINYVRLSDFDYHTKVMLKDSRDQLGADELDLYEEYDGSTFLVDLAAKNVLAGRLCLFNFDENFDYKYGQSNSHVYTNINSIKSKLTLDATSGNKFEDVTLSTNEYLEILYPNYYSDITYGSYVLYKWDSTTTIPKVTEYTIKGGETLTLKYKESENNPFITVELGTGTIIQSSFDVDPTDTSARPKYLDGFNQIASNESISTRKLLQTILNVPTYVYWVMNNSSNTLFKGKDPTDPSSVGDTEIILNEGEYFIYTDSTKTNLTILGRGTKLTRDNGDEEWSLPLSSASKISRSSFNDEGLAAKIPFINFDKFTTNPLTITEMGIITLGENDSFTLTASNSTIDYNLQFLADDEISYTTVDGKKTELSPQANFYEVRSRLDINVSKDKPLYLLNGRQIIDIETEDGLSRSLSGCFIQSNVSLTMVGNSSDYSQDLSVYGDFGIDINWFTYDTVGLTIKTITPTDNTIPDTTYRGWGCNVTKTDFKEFTNTNPPTTEVGSWFICEETSSSDQNIEYTYPVDRPLELEIPFSAIWYKYLIDQVDLINRQYICQLFLSNIGNNEGRVKVEFISYDPADPTVSTPVALGYYGHLNSDGTNNYLLNNQSVYIYPVITSEGIDSEGTANIKLKITVTADEKIVGGVLTIVDPIASWDVNGDLRVPLGSVVQRIDSLIDNSSDNLVQFHWVNNPRSDIAMTTTDLSDPYSLFDHNNVANIITIPEIDLEHSNIDILKSMRNY